MNPSILIVGYVVTRDDVGLIPVLFLWKLIISVQITLFFSVLVMFRWGQSELFWNGGNVFILMPCDLKHCGV